MHFTCYCRGGFKKWPLYITKSSYYKKWHWWIQSPNAKCFKVGIERHSGESCTWFRSLPSCYHFRLRTVRQTVATTWTSSADRGSFLPCVSPRDSKEVKRPPCLLRGRGVAFSLPPKKTPVLVGPLTPTREAKWNPLSLLSQLAASSLKNTPQKRKKELPVLCWLCRPKEMFVALSCVIAVFIHTRFALMETMITFSFIAHNTQLLFLFK